MINKIKNKLILTNTLVVIIILFFSCGIIYTLSSYTFSRSANIELSNIGYQSKRFINTGFKEKSGEYSYNQELKFFRETLKKNHASIVVFNDNKEKVYSYGSQKLKENILRDIAYSYFSSTRATSAISQPDGKYAFSLYKKKNISLVCCSTVTLDTNGALEVILITKDNANNSATLTKILYILIATSLIGLIFAVLGGYYTADKALIPIKQTIENQKQFIADASHELRTPIAVIKTNLELVESNEEETILSQKMWIDYAKNEITRMDRIVGDLLILSKADLNEIPFNNEENDIIHLTKQAIEAIEQVAIKNKQNIFCVSEYNKVFSLIDKDKYTQLIMILLDNAIKYSDEGKDIAVKVKVNDVKNLVTIEVEDKGIGISKEDIDKVFTRFYRVDKARSRRKNGSGLGLSIAKWIVDNLSGSIKIKSEENKGTTFIITLPLISYEENK